MRLRIDRKIAWATSVSGALVALLAYRLVAHVALYRHGFLALTADELSRTVVAARWAEFPSLYWQGEWLPFHAYLFGSALRLHYDLVWIPRSISIVFGCTSIALMYLVASTLLRSRAVGLLAAMLLALNPAHIWLSSVPLTEVPSAMLVLAALWGFAAYLDSARRAHLFVAAGALALANGFRFESWLLTALFSLAVTLAAVARYVRRRRSPFSVADLAVMGLAALVPWLFPVSWLVGNYAATRDPFYFMGAIDRYKLQWYGEGSAYGNYLDAFLAIDPFLTVFGILALAACWSVNRRSKAIHWYVLATTLPFALYVLMHGGRSEPSPNYLRYFTPFMILFYPAVAFCLHRIALAIPRSRPRALFLGTVLVVAGVTQVRQTFRYTNDPVAEGLPVGLAVKALREREPDLRPRPVVIELQYWQYLAVHVGADDLHDVIYDRTLDIAARDTESLLLSDTEQFRTCLKLYDVSYVIVKSKELRDVLQGEFALQSSADVNGYAFFEVEGGSLDDVANEASSACPLAARSFPDPPLIKTEVRLHPQDRS